MKTVILIDTANDSYEAIFQAAIAAGWNVISKAARTADAVVISADAAGLQPALQNLAAARRSGAVAVLVADFKHSGRDAVFGSTGMLEVDALFDKPVDGPAVMRRLDGIMAARASVERHEASEMDVILARAIVNEESSSAFYRQAADRVHDPVTRDALEGLMRDEIGHKQLIEEFRSGARPLPEGSTSGGSLVERFGSPDFTADMSPPDAFLLAAKKEKLAVEFYENWARLYPAGPERDLLLNLAEIERRHKLKVEAMFTNAAFPEAW
ncbi:MAG: ferritin family protein [bacterium]